MLPEVSCLSRGVVVLVGFDFRLLGPFRCAVACFARVAMHGVVMFRYSLGEEDSRVILQGRSEMVSEMKESEKG